MAAFLKIQVRPHAPKVGVGKPGGSATDNPEVFACPVDPCLPVSDHPHVGVGVDGVAQSSVECGVPFGLNVREQFDRFGDRPVVIDVECPERFEFREEPFDHQFLNGRGDRHRMFASGGVLPPATLTPVVERPAGPHGRFQGVAAPGAPQDTRQEPCATPGTSRCHPFGLSGSLECATVHERLMALEVDDALSAVDLPEINPVADHVPDRTDRPGTGRLSRQPVGNVPPRFPCRPFRERFTDQRGLRAGGESAGVVFHIAQGDGPADMHPAFDSVCSGNQPAFALPVNLELGDSRHDRSDHPARTAGSVDPFGDGEQGGVMFGENVKQFPEVGDGPAEPVEFRHDHPFAPVRLDTEHDLVEAGTVAFLAGLVEVFVNVVDMLAVKFRPTLDCSPLFAGGDEPFAFTAGDTADADISQGSHVGLGYRALVGSIGKGRATVFRSVREVSGVH